MGNNDAKREYEGYYIALKLLLTKHAKEMQAFTHTHGQQREKSRAQLCRMHA
jgi:hypothetical protein